MGKGRSANQNHVEINDRRMRKQIARGKIEMMVGIKELDWN
jgi:hypothetical protein